MFFCTISPFFFPQKIDMNFLSTCYSNSEAEVRVFPYQLVAEINNWVAYKETMCTWALPLWFIMQLGKCLILQSMNCKASTSPLSLLFFQTSHSLKWLQSIATSRIFPSSSTLVAMQPVVENYPRLPLKPSKEGNIYNIILIFMIM